MVLHSEYHHKHQYTIMQNCSGQFSNRLYIYSVLSFQVEEGVNPSKTSDGENADLDDLISAAMGDMADEDTQPEAETKRSSTPSKDDGGVDDADFGGFLSLIRDDSEQPPPVEDKKVDDKPRDIPVDRKSGGGKV